MNRIAMLLAVSLGGELLAASLGLGPRAYAHENHKAGDAKESAAAAKGAKGAAKGDAHADHGDGHAGHSHDEGEVVTVQGELIDTACFVASDGDARGKDHAECAAKCLGTGVPAAILPAKSKDAKGMMFLLTNPRPLAKHAAKTIKVEGTPHPDLHAIDVKKLYVQQGGKWQEVQLDDEHHKMSGEDGGHDHGEHEHGEGGHEAGDGHEGHDGADADAPRAQPKKAAKPAQK